MSKLDAVNGFKYNAFIFSVKKGPLPFSMFSCERTSIQVNAQFLPIKVTSIGSCFLIWGAECVLSKAIKTRDSFFSSPSTLDQYEMINLGKYVCPENHNFLLGGLLRLRVDIEGGLQSVRNAFCVYLKSHSSFGFVIVKLVFAIHLPIFCCVCVLLFFFLAGSELANSMLAPVNISVQLCASTISLK